MELLRYLSDKRQVTNLLVEGGGLLLGSLLDLQQIDQCEVFIAPKLIGGTAAPSPIAGLGFEKVGEGPRSHAIEYSPCGDDMHLRCRLDFRGHHAGT
jgi:diaminohydroxyphosphoribosylaminopyrimidine deaminase/5-amino-6-(5-phosphoribosylamino)uracil reductase